MVHAPILTGGDGCERVACEDTDQYRLTRSFVEAPERFLRRLLDP